MLSIRKTTLGEHNRGICGSRNNCYYKGFSICWAVDHPELEGLIAVKRKMDAQLIVKTINENEHDWDAPRSYCPLAKAMSLLEEGEDKWQLIDAKEV